MLRVLHLDNWKSFSEPVDFTMIAGKETRHGETLYLGSKNRVLPVAAIYGANAAGKSALLDALAHLQVMLREPRKRGQRLHYHPRKFFLFSFPLFNSFLLHKLSFLQKNVPENSKY